MIKLITQFDNEKSKLSLATPTCGCCSCCCCCCVVSTFAAASISARNFGNYVEKNLPNEPKKIKTARTFGFWFPIGLLISLALGLWIASLIDLNAIFMLVVIGILYLVIIANTLKEKLQLPGIISRVVGSSILLGVFEVIGFFLGMFALLYLPWGYVAGVIIISIFLMCWEPGKKYDNLTKEKEQENLSLNIQTSINNDTNLETDDEE